MHQRAEFVVKDRERTGRLAYCPECQAIHVRRIEVKEVPADAAKVSLD